MDRRNTLTRNLLVYHRGGRTVLLLPFLYKMHYIVHTSLSWTYWSSVHVVSPHCWYICGWFFIYLLIYHLPSLILCLTGPLGATLCHCHWLVMLQHAGWGLLGEFAEGRVTSAEQFFDQETLRIFSYFLKTWEWEWSSDIKQMILKITYFYSVT